MTEDRGNGRNRPVGFSHRNIREIRESSDTAESFRNTQVVSGSNAVQFALCRTEQSKFTTLNLNR
jgi:hypothetical protein